MNAQVFAAISFRLSAEASIQDPALANRTLSAPATDVQ